MRPGIEGRAVILSAVAPLENFRKGTLTLLATLVLIAIIFLQIGCAHYKLGRPGTLPFSSLYIAPATSETPAAQAQALLSRNLIEAFIRDGSVQVFGPQEAEATLRVVLVAYERKVSAAQADDTALGRSFEITLKAEATLLNNRSGEVYFSKRTFEASEQVFVGSSLPQSEYQAMPTLARRLANEIKNGIVNVWQ